MLEVTCGPRSVTPNMRRWIHPRTSHTCPDMTEEHPALTPRLGPSLDFNERTACVRTIADMTEALAP